MSHSPYEQLKIEYIEFDTEQNRRRILAYSRSASWANVFCKYHVRNDAIIGAIQKASGVLLMRGINNVRKQSTPLGFLIYRVLPWPTTSSNDRVMYIDIICSKRSGKEMISTILQLAKTRYNCQYAMLYALPQVMPYYRRLGFRHQYPPIKPKSTCIMKEPGPVQYRANKIEFQRVDSMDEALKNSDYRQLIRTLIREKLSADRACAKESDPIRQCSIYGFVMSKCL
jgi:hypothetical protein